MIREFELFSCDAGWRNYHFLKITDDSGECGWSEFDEAFSPPGTASVLPHYRKFVIGSSPLEIEHTIARMRFMNRPAPNGLSAHAVGAIENALLDLKAKLLGVPCYQLLGGKLRDTIPVYWSHCATWRISHPDFYSPPITDLKGVQKIGAEARERGFKALKTNIFRYTNGKPRQWMPGFGAPWQPDLPVDAGLIRDIRDHLEALRDGAGPDMGILIDLNFNARTDGYLQILKSLEDFPLYWVELDNHNPEALAIIRSKSAHPIASLETLFGASSFVPYFALQAVDTAIIDPIWNGAQQSMKIAHLADAHDVSVAGHNFYGHLASMINVHFLVASENLRVLEYDVDRLPWDDELFTEAPEFRDGALVVPDKPGWGIWPNEDAVRARSPREIKYYLGFKTN